MSYKPYLLGASTAAILIIGDYYAYIARARAQASGLASNANSKINRNIMIVCTITGITSGTIVGVYRLSWIKYITSAMAIYLATIGIAFARANM